MTSLGDSPPITAFPSHAHSQSQSQSQNSLAGPTATPSTTPASSQTLPLLNSLAHSYSSTSTASANLSSALSATVPILAMAIAPGATSPTAATIPLDDSPALSSAKRHRALAGYSDGHYELPAATGELSPPISHPVPPQHLTGMRVDFDMPLPDADPAGMTSIGWKRDANGNVLSYNTRKLGMRLPGAVEALQTLSPATAMATALMFAPGTMDKILNPQQVRLPPAADTSDSGVKVLSGYEDPQKQWRYGAAAAAPSSMYPAGSTYGAASGYAGMSAGYANAAAGAAGGAMYRYPTAAAASSAAAAKYPQAASGYGYMAASAGAMGAMNTPTANMYKQSRPYAATTTTSMNTSGPGAHGADPYGGMAMSQYGYGVQYQMYGTDAKGNPMYMSQMPMQMMQAYPYQGYMAAPTAGYPSAMPAGAAQAQGGAVAGPAAGATAASMNAAHAYSLAQSKGAYAYPQQSQTHAQYPYMYYQYYPNYDPHAHAQAQAQAHAQAHAQAQANAAGQTQVHAPTSAMPGADVNASQPHTMLSNGVPSSAGTHAGATAAAAPGGADGLGGGTS